VARLFAVGRVPVIWTLVVFYDDLGGNMTLEEILYAIRQKRISTICGGDDWVVDDSSLEPLVNAFRENASLTALDINQQCTTDYAVSALASVLQANSSITSLNISRPLSCMNVVVPEPRGLVEAIKANTSLRSLSLWGTRLGAAGLIALADAMTVHTTFTAINLNYNARNGDSDFEEEVCVQVLAKACKANKSLTSLSLGLASLSPSGLEALAEAWQANSSLSSIRLNCRGFRLTVGFGVLVETLVRLPVLRSLNLNYVCVDDAGAEALAFLVKTSTSLTALHLSETLGQAESGQIAVLEALKVNDSLTSIDLSQNKLLPSSALALAEVLEVNTALADINLRNSRLGKAGMQAIGAALAVNNTLTAINLTGNERGFWSANFLAKSLEVNVSLKKLVLANNRISTFGIHVIAAALRVNTVLSELDLSGCRGTDSVGFEALTAALQENVSLTSISLAGMTRGAPMSLVGAMADVLRVNTSLNTICLPELGRLTDPNIAGTPAAFEYSDYVDFICFDEMLKQNTTLIKITGCTIPREDYEDTIWGLLRRNQRRLFFIRSEHGLKYTILYGLFNKSLFENSLLNNIPSGRKLPSIIKLQLTEYAIKLQLLNKDILCRAVMLGWCLKTVEEALSYLQSNAVAFGDENDMSYHLC
jgi:Ran GTPase-activating protein (RanGAP) involved in mRNA processing and transport